MHDFTVMHIATIRRDNLAANEAGPLQFDAWASLETNGKRHVMHGNRSDGFQIHIRTNLDALEDLRRLSERSPRSVTICAQAALCLHGKMDRAKTELLLGALVDVLEMDLDLPPQSQFNELADCFSDPQWLRDIFENAVANSPNPGWEGLEHIRARIHEAAAQGVARRRDEQRAQCAPADIGGAQESSLLAW